MKIKEKLYFSDCVLLFAIEEQAFLIITMIINILN